ncbi:MAG: CHASE domain-containing protein [bacterium]
MTRTRRRQPIIAGLLTFALGASLAAVLAERQSHRNVTAAQERFDGRAQRMADDIASRLRIYEYALRAARGAVNTAGIDQIDRKAFAAYSASRDLAREFPGARGVGVIRRVAAHDVQRFVATARGASTPLSLHELSPNSGERFIIQFIEPEAPNNQALGLDIASEQTRRTAALASIQSGAATMSAPLSLVQASVSSQKAFLLLLPVFRPDAPIVTAEERDRATIGWTFAPLVIDDVLRDIRARNGRLALTLSDNTTGAPNQFFTSVGSGAADIGGLVRRVVIPVYGRMWVAEVRATPAFWREVDQLDPRLVLAVCLTLALLLGALAAFYTRSVERERQVREMRDAMATSNEALLDRAGRVAGIGGWEMDIPTGVITWSAQTYRIHDVAADYVPRLDTTLAFYAGEASAVVELALSGSIASGEPWDMEVPFITASGRRIWVRTVGTAELVDGKAVRLVGALQDITARKETEALLEYERHLFTSLIDTIPDSIYFKDTRSRFLRINSALARELKLSDPADAIGKSDADFFTAAHAATSSLVEQGIMASGAGIHEEEEHALWLNRPPTWSLSTRMPLYDRNGHAMGTFGIGRDVTTRKLLEVQLKRTNDRMQLAANAAQLGVWEYDVIADCLTWDDRMFTIYGASPSVGAKPYALWSESLHPDDRIRAEREVAEAVEWGMPFESEFRIVRSDGEIRHLQAAAQAVRDASGAVVQLTGVNQDITDQKRAEREQVETSSLLRTVLDSASEVSIIATDPNSLITVFNSGAERLLGYRSAEVVGLATPDIIHDADEVRARAAELTARFGRTVHPRAVFREPETLSTPREWTYRRKDGSRVTVSLVVTAMRDEDGRILGYLGIAHDVTLQKETERSLRVSMHTERQANLAKSQFLANMSHEIRTPLNAVIGLSYLLGKTMLEPAQETMLGKIGIASRSLLAVINDVLDLSKIEAGELIVERVVFDVRGLLQDLSDVMSVNAESKSIAYTLAVDEDIPFSVEGDPTRLTQVLTNLVSNAIKFTAVGGVHLVVRRADGALGPTAVQFIVRDTGIGIPIDAQARLFAPFAQADASTTRRFGGTGLGLSIVKRLANLMGGDVDFSSVSGAGSEFRVTLPLGSVLGSEHVARAVLPTAFEDSGLKGVRVLVVDDSDVNREVAQRIIELEGAIVTLASDGQQAIDRLRATPRGFDVVLMDVQMPLLDGNEATRIIRRNLGLADLPIIALTAGAMLSERAQSTAAGMNAFISKPFDPRMLVRTIREHLRATPAQQPAEVAVRRRKRVAVPMRLKISGVETDMLGETLRNDRTLFEMLMSRLLEEYRVVEVPTLPIDAAAMRELESRMHKLKGSSGTLGATSIYRAASEAEQACMAGNGARAVELVASIERMFGELRESFEDAVRNATVRIDDADAPDDRMRGGALTLEVQALVTQLHEQNLGALDHFRDLSANLRRRMGEQPFASVREQIDTLQFDAAAKMLTEWSALPSAA